MIQLQTEEQILENKKYMLEKQFEHMIGNLQLDFSNVVDQIKQLLEVTHNKLKINLPEVEQRVVDICIENYNKRFNLDKEEFDENFEFSVDIAYNEHAMEAFEQVRMFMGLQMFLEQLKLDIHEYPAFESDKAIKEYFAHPFDYHAVEQTETEELNKESEDSSDESCSGCSNCDDSCANESSEPEAVSGTEQLETTETTDFSGFLDGLNSQPETKPKKTRKPRTKTK